VFLECPGAQGEDMKKKVFGEESVWRRKCLEKSGREGKAPRADDVCY
jgi:hypothetical protein